MLIIEEETYDQFFRRGQETRAERTELLSERFRKSCFDFFIRTHI